MHSLWDISVRYWPDVVLAFVLGVIVDLLRIGSLIRIGIEQVKNKAAEGSVTRLRKRIAKLETLRETIKSYSDKAIYVGALRAILAVLVLMCSAALPIIADSMGVLQNGKVLGSCILAYTIGVTVAAMRFFSLDTDNKQKFEHVIRRLDEDISALETKLRKRISR
jgi:hypothetical protein